MNNICIKAALTTISYYYPTLGFGGLEPACVKHCMASCIKYGKIEELAQEMGKKPRMVLWAPRS